MFITDHSLYCYQVIPFGFKNIGATYQHLVNKMFASQIGKTMEVYLDNILVKSVKAENHLQHLRMIVSILRKYKMKLNSNKYAFGVSFSKFLVFIVN